jgi:hypothetical protein
MTSVYFRRIKSIRRFSFLSFSRIFEEIGFDPPKPVATNLLAFIPREIR